MSNLKTSQHFLSVVNPVVEHNSLIPNPLPGFYLAAVEKNREKAWDHYYVMWIQFVLTVATISGP